MAHALGVEQHEQVERARIGELAGAETAHAEHGEPRRRRFVPVGRREAAPREGLPQQVVERAGEHGIGKPAERLGDPIQRPGAGDFGERHGERRAPPERPKPAGEDAAICRLTGGVRDLVERARVRGAGALLGHLPKLSRLAD